MPEKLVLLGAYGYTAAMIAEKLAAKNIFPVLAGRNMQNLTALQRQISGGNQLLGIDITINSELQNLLDFDIIINCVGPYNLYSKNILDFCIKYGKTYLDICGEQAFVFDSYSRKSEIDNSGACVVHSLAFESALADLLAAEIVDENEVYEDISSFYYFENPAYSRGSRFSMQAMKHFPIYTYMENAFRQTQSYAHAHNLPNCFNGDLQALFIPYPELIFFANNYKTKNAATWYIMDADDAFYATSHVQQTPKSIETISQKFAKQQGGPEKEEMDNQLFRLAVEARSISGETKCIAIEGNDTYELTAEIMVQAVLHLLENREKAIGLFSPAQFLKYSYIINTMLENQFIMLI